MEQEPAKDGKNWYAYAGGNPVERVDPNGWEWCWHILGGCIGTGCHGDPTCPPKKPKGGGGGDAGGQGGKGGGGQVCIRAPRKPCKPDDPCTQNNAPSLSDCQSCKEFPGEPYMAYTAWSSCCKKGLDSGSMNVDTFNRCQKEAAGWMDLHQPVP